MNSRCTIEVALHLTGVNVNPEEITNFLGLSPTRIWRIGDVIGRSSLKRKQDGWVFGLPKQQTIDLENMLLTLMDSLAPYQDQIAAIARQLGLEIELSCAIYMENQTPVGHFGISTLQRMVALGADLDIDLIGC